MTATSTSAPRPAALRAFIVDSAYATIVGGATVGIVRSIGCVRGPVPAARVVARQVPKRLRGARDRGVASVHQLLDQGVATSRGLPGLAGREFDDLASARTRAGRRHPHQRGHP